MQALSAPGALPDAPGGCDAVVQTHASVVLLSSDRAWKLKKPVNLGFLDFSTLEARRADCERELALNRRLAPDVYLGLAAAVMREGALRVVRDIAPGEQAVEWLIEMRRLPEGGMLDRRIPAGGVDAAMLMEFAERLAAFHRDAASGPEVSRHGEADVLRRRLQDNLERLASHATQPAGPRQLAPVGSILVSALARAACGMLERVAPILEMRRAQGSVRDGHGDLHAGNLCLRDGRIVAYDCLEFRDEYRCADVAMDVAFLCMDLERLGRPDLSAAFAQAYARASGDTMMDAPLRLFKMNYAIVRAMVEAIRLHQPETPVQQRGAILSLVRSYACLAAGYAVEPATVVLMGLPASGKSSLAHHLVPMLRACVLSSDAVRKGMHGISPTARAPESAYSAESTAATYAALADRSRQCSGSVIIDAAHLRREQRASSVAAAAVRSGTWLLVEVDADRATIERRMRRREADPMRVSDAGIDVHDRARALREAPDELPRSRLVALRSTDGGEWLDAAAQQVLADLLSQAALHA